MIEARQPPSGERKILIRVKRQDAPGQPTRWEEFAVPHRANLTIISCLQWIAGNPVMADGKPTTPPAWEASCLEEICGACSMVINGKARPACSALVERIAETDTPITVESMSKFPVVRDLVVDRNRLFEDFKRVKAWVPIDGTYNIGPGPARSRQQQEERYPLSRCIGCGCCMDACPQYTLTNKFVGAAVINQARLFNEHPVGAELKTERLETLMEQGGVGDCGKAGNCVAACPKEIPLMESIAAVQRAATLHVIKKFFSK